MKIFIAPKSTEHISGRFKKTPKGYVKADLESFFDKDDLKALEKYEHLHIWGNKPHHATKWREMEPGQDWIFFYRSKNINGCGKLLHKKHSEGLAQALWGDSEGQTGKTETWEYVYFVDKIIPTNIEWSKLCDYAGYKQNYVLRGFKKYRKGGMDRIINEYKSIELFVNKHKTGQKSFEEPDNTKVNNWKPKLF